MCRRIHSVLWNVSRYSKQVQVQSQVFWKHSTQVFGYLRTSPSKFLVVQNHSKRIQDKSKSFETSPGQVSSQTKFWVIQERTKCKTSPHLDSSLANQVQTLVIWKKFESPSQVKCHSKQVHMKLGHYKTTSGNSNRSKSSHEARSETIWKFVQVICSKSNSSKHPVFITGTKSKSSLESWLGIKSKEVFLHQGIFTFNQGIWIFLPPVMLPNRLVTRIVWFPSQSCFSLNLWVWGNGSAQLGFLSGISFRNLFKGRAQSGWGRWGWVDAT